MLSASLPLVSNATISISTPLHRPCLLCVQHGGNWDAVNGNTANAGFTFPVPVGLAAGSSRGLGSVGTYASEFGGSVYSSFESMAPTLNPEHWGIHGGMANDSCDNKAWPSVCKGGNPMAQRNYPGDNWITSAFPKVTPESLNATGEAAFKRQLFQVMLAQALYLKSDIETRRSDNQFGTITWQLNEIWPTGGWGRYVQDSPYFQRRYLNYLYF